MSALGAESSRAKVRFWPIADAHMSAGPTIDPLLPLATVGFRESEVQCGATHTGRCARPVGSCVRFSEQQRMMFVTFSPATNAAGLDLKLGTEHHGVRAGFEAAGKDRVIEFVRPAVGNHGERPRVAVQVREA